MTHEIEDKPMSESEKLLRQRARDGGGYLKTSIREYLLQERTNHGLPKEEDGEESSPEDLFKSIQEEMTKGDPKRG